MITAQHSDSIVHTYTRHGLIFNFDYLSVKLNNKTM